MIVFDKRKSTYEFVVTVSEKGISNGTQLLLRFHSAYTNKSYALILPENSSQYSFRYDDYLISDFEDYEVGMYNYSIVEYDPFISQDRQVLEVGLLKVISNPVQTFVSVGYPETDDDFLVLADI